MNYSQRYKSYLLVLLMAILAFNYVDRVVLGLVLQDIKAEFDLSDTQLGILSGIAFALFYSVMGIPIARWADRGNRITIITLTTALWSAAVILCGMAGSFIYLLLIRVVVGVGEAGCLPPAHSLIADHFTRAERARAVGIYTMGAPLSVVVGYFAAGWLNQFYGWRTTFIILGLPGFVLAALVWLTLREPRQAAPKPVQPANQPGVMEVLATLWTNVTFRRILLCIAVSNFFTLGIFQWLPVFFIRSYGLQTGEIGTWFALAIGLSGVLGNYWGGVLASRYLAHNEQRQLQAMSILIGIGCLVSACVYLVPNQYWAFAFLGLTAMMLTATNGPVFAVIQTLMPARMRAMSVAIVLFFANLIGLGLGPLAVGALSDAFRPWLGEESLRYGLLALCPGYLLCAGYMWSASNTVTRDLAANMEPQS